MNAPTIEHMSDTVQHVTDTVQDVAHKVAERAPDIASAVGRGARSTVDNVSDAVVKLAAMTPFVEAPKPAHDRARWMLRIAIVAAVAGLATWYLKRRRAAAQSWHDIAETTAEPAQPAPRRFATAGR